MANPASLGVLTSFYADPEATRHAELVDCLRRNLENTFVDEVHVLLEDGVRPELDHVTKLHFVELGRRATYADLFAYANERLCGRRVVIANADIYFDDGLARLGAIDLDDTLLCVSRWDVERDGSACFFEHGESQDAWIFDAPIREFPCGFPLGVPGCDNRLAWEAASAGLAVHNPARSLRAFHLHTSLVRRYTQRERIGGAVLSVPADYLGPARAAPTASAAFREEMGYSVRALEPGVSSHVNADRPLTAIPDVLRGRHFTQVVAHVVAPIELEFLTPGKLFVLVGDDWWGSEAARAWLAENGFYERLPQVETAAGTGFEVWSLLGEPGDRFIVPTQVMLVGEQLVPRRPA